MNNVTWLDFNNAPDSSQTFPEKMNSEAVKQALCDNLPHVLRHLFPNGKKNGSHYEVGDIWGNKGKSMKIALTGNDKGLWIDHATGDKGDILHLWALCNNQCIKSQFHEVTQSAANWLGIAPLEAPISLPKAEPVSLGHHSAKYDYYSADHKLIACVYRYDTETGKEFRPFDVTSGKSKAPEPRPLYNLPNIMRQSQVILCEGEKSADSLIKLGIPATTAMFGSKAPLDKTDWSPLKNKHVIIWPDNDVPGQEYAQKLQAFLPSQGIASVSILPIPKDKKEGWDAADAILEEMDVKAYLAEHISEPDQPFISHTINTLFQDHKAMPEDIIAPRILTPGGMVVFGGAPKVGKSDFLLSWIINMGIGKEFIGMRPKRPLNIFYLQAEMAYDYLRERIQRIPITAEEKKIVSHRVVLTDHFKMSLNENGIKHVFNAIKKHFPKQDVDIIVIDPLYNVFDTGEHNASENDNQAMFDFLQNRVCYLRDLVNPKAGIVLCHHTRKIDRKTLKDEPFQAFSGASSLRRFYTSGIIMYQPDPETAHRKLIFELRNGASIPSKLIGKSQRQWVELDESEERIVQQNYGQKLDAERRRKQDVILDIIFNQAAQGNVYTSTQFCQAFEGTAGLGGKEAIRTRLDVLCTKGYVQFFKNSDDYDLPKLGRSKFGFMCVEDMKLKVTEEDKTKHITILPTHYKCPQTGASIPVQSPEQWVYQAEENNADD